MTCSTRLSDATFFGYWDADCPVSVTPPLKASAYVTADAMVIVVANLTPEPAEGTLRVNGEARDYVVVEVTGDE